MNNSRKPFTEQEKEIIKRMREERKSYSEIGKTLGRSRSAIKSYCQRNNLGGRKGNLHYVEFTDKEKEIITRMRSEGKSYDEITKVINRNKSLIGKYCRRNGLGGYRKRKEVENPEQEFLDEFNKRFRDKFEYVSGYKNCKSSITLKCKMCNGKFERKGDMVTKRRGITCPYCAEREQQMKGLREVQRKQQKELQCRIKRLKRRVEEGLKKIERIRRCEDCDDFLVARTINTTRCKGCSRKRQNRKKDERMKRALENGKFDNSISLEKIIRKEKNLCYLCGGECNSNDFAIDDKGSFIVGPNYPTIEHIIPISKGGTHTWDNVKLAHHYCNTMKRDKEVLQDSGQLCLSL